MAAAVTDYQRAPCGPNVCGFRGLHAPADLRRRIFHDRYTAARGNRFFRSSRWLTSGMQRQHVRIDIAGPLLALSVISRRQQAAIQGVAQFRDPGVVKVVKRPRAYTGPVVCRHGLALGLLKHLGRVSTISSFLLLLDWRVAGAADGLAPGL